MHRVELKVFPSSFSDKKTLFVPNAPCGVERLVNNLFFITPASFLMHRVELKGGRRG